MTLIGPSGLLAQRVGPTGRSIKDNGPTHLCPGGGPVLPQLTNEHALFVSKSLFAPVVTNFYSYVYPRPKLLLWTRN